jgi:ABC-type transporter Mla MlaB component
MHDGQLRATALSGSIESVLKITTTKDNNDSSRIRLCGQLTAEYVTELEQALVEAGRDNGNVALDLLNVTFVDRDAMVFLCGVRSRNIPIENIPSYVIRWIEQERRCGSSRPDTSKEP